jgi:hypothetical protein
VYTAALDIFRVINIPNRQGKRDNLLAICPAIGSQSSSLEIMLFSVHDLLTAPPGSGGQAAQAAVVPNPSFAWTMEETGTGLLLGDSHHNLARLQEDEWQVQVQRQPFSGVNALEDAVTRRHS